MPFYSFFITLFILFSIVDANAAKKQLITSTEMTAMLDEIATRNGVTIPSIEEIKKMKYDWFVVHSITGIGFVDRQLYAKLIEKNEVFWEMYYIMQLKDSYFVIEEMELEKMADFFIQEKNISLNFIERNPSLAPIGIIAILLIAGIPIIPIFF